MLLVEEKKESRKNCIECPGCERVTSSARCVIHCERWLDLRIREVSSYAKSVKIPSCI